jgi:hypothetical protein
MLMCSPSAELAACGFVVRHRPIVLAVILRLACLR